MERHARLSANMCSSARALLQAPRAAIEEFSSFCFAVPARTFVMCVVLSASGVAVAVNDGASPAWLVLCAMLAAVIGLARRSLLCLMVLALIPVVSYNYANWRIELSADSRCAALAGHGQAVFLCRVVDAAPAGVKRKSARVAVERTLFPPAAAEGSVLLLRLWTPAGKEPPQLARGSRLKVKARVRKPPCADHPWQFDERAFLRRQGIYFVARARADDVVVVEPSQGAGSANAIECLDRLIERLRRLIIEQHRLHLGSENGDLLSSIVLGNRVVRPPEGVVEDFRRVGLAHLLAASGFHLTVVLGSVHVTTSLVLKNRFLVTALCLLAVVLFVLLSGASASVLRAAIMCVLVLLARCAFRTPHGLAVLHGALAALVLVDPLALVDVGFQLSFSATAGIILLSRRLERLLSESLRCPVFLSRTAAVILGAQTGILPLLLWYFWQLGGLFLVCNMVVSPLVPLVAVLGFASSTCALGVAEVPAVGGACRVLDWSAWLPLTLLKFTARNFASWEWAQLVVGPPCIPAIVLYYGALAAFALALERRALLPAAIFFYGLGLASLFWQPPLPPLTVARFERCTAFLYDDRSGVFLGEMTASARRFFTCHGCKPRAASAADMERINAVISSTPALARAIRSSRKGWMVEVFPGGGTKVDPGKRRWKSRRRPVGGYLLQPVYPVIERVENIQPAVLVTFRQGFCR